MSSHAKVVVFYGICYAPDSEAAAKFHSGDDGKSEGEGSPAWMAANLYREAREGVEMVHFGHYDLPGFALAVEGTVAYGQLWKPLELNLPSEEPKTGAAVLLAFCTKHGLPWITPTWWAVPYYG